MTARRPKAKCVIEIFRVDKNGAREVLRQVLAHSISPNGAKTKAETLLRRARRANGVRITIDQGQELYSRRC